MTTIYVDLGEKTFEVMATTSLATGRVNEYLVKDARTKSVPKRTELRATFLKSTRTKPAGFRVGVVVTVDWNTGTVQPKAHKRDATVWVAPLSSLPTGALKNNTLYMRTNARIVRFDLVDSNDEELVFSSNLAIDVVLKVTK